MHHFGFPLEVLVVFFCAILFSIYIDLVSHRHSKEITVKMPHFGQSFGFHWHWRSTFIFISVLNRNGQISILPVMYLKRVYPLIT